MDTANAVKWNSNFMFPQDSYKLRIMEEKFAPSSGGNPMVTFELEIDAPEYVEFGDKTFIMSGVKCRKYFPVIVFEGGERNEDKTQKAQARLKEFYEKLEWTPETDWENPALGHKGKLLWADMYGNKEEKRKSPTAEQLKKGQPGDVRKNPVTGEPLLTYNPAIGEVFGKAEADSNKAF